MSFRRAMLSALATFAISAIPQLLMAGSAAAQGTYNNNGGYNNQGTYNNQAPYNGAQTITCTTRSRGAARKYCAADTSGSVTLQRQTSNATCTQGSTWDYDEEGIWVSRGCGGVFAVNPADTNSNYGNNTGNYGGYGQRRDRGQYGNGPTTTQTVRCQSNGNNGQRQYCPADARGGVHVVNELSDNICRQGSTWGYDNGGIWVSNGCAADFEVDGTRRSYTGRTTTIPSGSQISIRADEAIDSKQAYVGQRFAADVASDVSDSNGNVIIPRGSQAELILRDTSGNSNNNGNYNNNGNTSANGNSNLALDLDSVTVNGERYVVNTEDMTRSGTGIGANKKTGEYVGGGALLGAIIGAIAGGGKGAAIGAGVGGAAGAGGVILTRGHQVNVPVETVLNFKLNQDLTLQAVR